MYPSSPSAWSTQVTEIITGVPLLSIACSGTNVLLSWPGATNDLWLEVSDSFVLPNWTNVTQSQSVTNGVVYVRAPAGRVSQWFRLRQNPF